MCTPPRKRLPASCYVLLYGSCGSLYAANGRVGRENPRGTGVLYYVLCHASPWQATFGKRLMKIYVADNYGRRLTAARSLSRWFLHLWPLIPISMITIVATQRKRALYDFAVGTVVLKGKPSNGGFMEPWRIIFSIGLPPVLYIMAWLDVMSSVGK